MSSSKKLRFSRWRRLPGVFRTGDHPRADADDGTRRLTLYVTWRLLDQAELLAKHAGSPSIQHYCESLLEQAIANELAELKINQTIQQADSPLEGLAQIAGDADYLREWSGFQAMAQFLDADQTEPSQPPTHPVEIPIEIEPLPLPALENESHSLQNETLPAPLAYLEADPDPDPQRTQAPSPDNSPSLPNPSPREPIQLILHHAGIITLQPDPGLLDRLRRGEPLHHQSIHDLLSALQALERQLVDQHAIDRRLAYALHRLAFEGQILITDAWPELATNPDTIAILRAVQEQVDRILSGQDIRYHEPAPPLSLS